VIRRLKHILILALLLCANSAAQTRKERAWQILEAGAGSKNFSSRAVAVRVLGLLPADAHALAMAEKALQDEESSVRIAAATALGQIGAKRAVPKLQASLNDPDIAVILAAAHALTALGDEFGDRGILRSRFQQFQPAFADRHHHEFYLLRCDGFFRRDAEP